MFRHLCCQFEANSPSAIVGANGSGKSTLLQILSGSMMPSEGSLSYHDAEGHPIAADNLFGLVSFTAPYLELIDDFTPLESLAFIHQFRKLLPGFSFTEIADWVELPSAARKKPIRYLSSGMQQRVKLAHAFFLQSSILLLDEPCTNLDREGVNMYHRLIDRFSQHRILIIASNRQDEYDMCVNILSIEAFKPQASS
ncbi:MAG: ATP-binding cassette domain-containing protein [Thermoflavifilum sp.]|nr:ATP-binding cassette domain-containing protein [Thermoflavifilum sp.]